MQLYFDVNKTQLSAFSVFSIKFLKRNEISGFLSNRNGPLRNIIGEKLILESRMSKKSFRSWKASVGNCPWKTVSFISKTSS